VRSGAPARADSHESPARWLVAATETGAGSLCLGHARTGRAAAGGVDRRFDSTELGGAGLLRPGANWAVWPAIQGLEIPHDVARCGYRAGAVPRRASGVGRGVEGES